MNDLLAALLLGIIEGITEFLPISSTGHLLIAEHWLGARSDLFNVAIQAGAILAVVLIYWKRLWGMLLAFAGRDAPAAFDPLGITATPAQSRAYAIKLMAAFGVTAVLGLLVKKLGWQLPESVTPVAWALVLGALWMLAAEWLAG
ncbi:MAG TPA: undecaprenyl-diphosphate phosphatase, partial [Thermomonas sp.]|nr:undecaprenyl-diphosphate phosphatase [Thermomonas sp.]